MPDYRKPPVPTSRPEPAAPAAPDSISFSIETTTMRLKSLKLRRTEAADRELNEQLRANSPQPARNAPARDADIPAGRVRHDERGMAVWDWAVASGEFAALSATNVMRKLDVGDLKIEETQRAVKAMESPRDAGGDPYNQRKNPSDSYNPYNPHGKAPPPAVPGGDPYNTRATPKPAGTIKRPPPAPVTKPAGSVLDQLMGKKK